MTRRTAQRITLYSMAIIILAWMYDAIRTAEIQACPEPMFQVCGPSAPLYVCDFTQHTEDETIRPGVEHE